MKDYSKYFKNPESFITNIRTTEEEIIITFANGTEWTYDLTRENITWLYQILESQYREVIANSKTVTNNRLTNILFWCLLASLFAVSGLSIIDSSIIIPADLTMPALALSGVGVLGTIINEKVKKNHQKSIDTYDSVISSLDELKGIVPIEENILSNISTKGRTSLATEQALENAHLVSTAFNINWVDHMSKEELTKLQEQIKIYQGLNDTVEIVSPKTKKRVPNSEK